MSVQERVVYILGAGFSAPLGLPLMSTFLSRSKDLFAKEPAKYVALFKPIFDEVDRMAKAKNYYSADLFNIEELLSLLEMGAFANANRRAVEFKEYICAVIEGSMLPLSSSNRGSLPSSFIFGDSSSGNWLYYGPFVAAILGMSIEHDQQTNTLSVRRVDRPRCVYDVITLNYDRIPEVLAAHVLANARTLQGTGPAPGFDVFPSSGERDHSKPLLAKLHGSSEDPSSIVPPTWNKGRSEHIASAWRYAHEALSKANHIRFIGYSLPVTDAYFKYLLKSSVLDSDNLKTIDAFCLDHSHIVEQQYRSFITFNTFRFVSGDTLSYLRKVRGSLPNYQPDDMMWAHLEAAHESMMTNAVG